MTAFFFTAALSVVTGGTSLLTVPVMLAFGIEPHVAVATNMLALIFLSLGGTLPFLKGKRTAPAAPAHALAATRADPSPRAEAVGFASTFVLGIYGGFFSGGYVALLMAACIACFQLTFAEAVAVTKVLNLFSSLVATLIFAQQGLVDGRLALILSAASFAGAWLGAVLARRVSNRWLRRVFVAAVLIMALKTLLFDVPWISR